MPLADARQTPSAGESSSPSMQALASNGAVRVVAPARLHLGFLDLNGGLGRRFGSIGLAIDQPRTDLILARSATSSADGPDSKRALAALGRFAAALSLSTFLGGCLSDRLGRRTLIVSSVLLLLPCLVCVILNETLSWLYCLGYE